METLEWARGTVSAVRHDPAKPRDALLVLAHGAGGSVGTAALRDLADAIADRGVAVLRFNFPYAERGRRMPGSPREAIDCFRDIAEAAGSGGRRVFIGGKSYGGRMASHVAAEGVAVAGLVFVGYPLHAPGKTDAPRDGHLSEVTARMLFLQGTSDAFARLDLIRATAARLPSATLHLVEGADHGFAVRGRASADVTEELARVIVEWIG